MEGIKRRVGNRRMKLYDKVIESIEALDVSSSGVSVAAIKKYIIVKFLLSMDSKINDQLKNCLEEAVKSQRIIRITGRGLIGSFKRSTIENSSLKPSNSQMTTNNPKSKPPSTPSTSIAADEEESENNVTDDIENEETNYDTALGESNYRDHSYPYLCNEEEERMLQLGNRLTNNQDSDLNSIVNESFGQTKEEETILPMSIVKETDFHSDSSYSVLSDTMNGDTTNNDADDEWEGWTEAEPEENFVSGTGRGPAPKK